MNHKAIASTGLAVFALVGGYFVGNLISLLATRDSALSRPALTSSGDNAGPPRGSPGDVAKELERRIRRSLPHDTLQMLDALASLPGEPWVQNLRESALGSLPEELPFEKLLLLRKHMPAAEFYRRFCRLLASSDMDAIRQYRQQAPALFDNQIYLNSMVESIVSSRDLDKVASAADFFMEQGNRGIGLALLRGFIQEAALENAGDMEGFFESFPNVDRNILREQASLALVKSDLPLALDIARASDDPAVLETIVATAVDGVDSYRALQTDLDNCSPGVVVMIARNAVAQLEQPTSPEALADLEHGLRSLNDGMVKDQLLFAILQSTTNELLKDRIVNGMTADELRALNTKLILYGVEKVDKKPIGGRQ